MSRYRRIVKLFEKQKSLWIKKIGTKLPKKIKELKALSEEET